MANGSGFDANFYKNQALAFTRGGIWFAAGFTVGYGVLNGETAVTMAGAVVGLLGGGWTTIANSNSSIVQAAAQVPEVKRMDITDPKLAGAAKQAAPDTVVVPAKET